MNFGHRNVVWLHDLRMITSKARVPIVLFLRSWGLTDYVERFVFRARVRYSEWRGKKTTQMQSPHVLIVCANYNHAKWLPDCLKSLQNQTHQLWSVVVVDDASDDDSVSIAKEFAATDSRIHLLKLNENSGAYVARNTGVEFANQAHTPWTHIGFIDPDDVAEPRWLSHVVALFDENTIAVRPWLVRVDKRMEKVMRNYHGYCQSVFTKGAWSDLGGFFDVRVSGDAELLSRARALSRLTAGEIRFAFEPCQKCRVHASNASATNLESRKLWLEDRQRKIVKVQRASDLFVEPKTSKYTTP